MVLITVLLDCFSPETLFGQQPNTAEDLPSFPWMHVPQKGKSEWCSARKKLLAGDGEIGSGSEVLLVPDPPPPLVVWCEVFVPGFRSDGREKKTPKKFNRDRMVAQRNAFPADRCCVS